MSGKGQRYQNVKLAHVSMQYSDTREQMAEDCAKVFSRGYTWLTGTEAGADNPLAVLIPRTAEAHGYRVHRVRDVWIAVDRELVRGGWRTGYVPVIESTEGKGRHTDKGIGWVAFNTRELGRISIGAAHLLTKGRRPGDPNYRLNRRFSDAFRQWVVDAGQGSGLAFYGGDQNIPDRKQDTFMGAPLTSAWDELGRWENTGHGNIDVIASYDRDGRVSAVKVRALDDKQLHLHTDHFLVEASFRVRKLQAGAQG